MRTRYAGTRLERQELDGQLLTDNPGALWTEELIERCRLNPSPCRGEGQVREANQGEGPTYVEGAGPGPHPSAATRLPPSPLQGEGFSPFLRLIIAVPPTGTAPAESRLREGRRRKGPRPPDHSSPSRDPTPGPERRERTALWNHLPQCPRSSWCRIQPGRLMVLSVPDLGPRPQIKMVPAIRKIDRAAPWRCCSRAGGHPRPLPGA